jgi:cytoskeletal protein CcmA (bactofilin family)
MFKKSKSNSNSAISTRSSDEVAVKKSSSISQKTKIVGNFYSEDSLSIDGLIEGEVLVRNHVVIGKTGVVKANMKIQSIQIFGKVIGDVVANGKVTIERTGIIEGNIVAPKLAISEGAVFRGNIEMTRQEKNPPAIEKVAQPAPAKLN